jgi:hypothetical protein
VVPINEHILDPIKVQIEAPILDPIVIPTQTSIINAISAPKSPEHQPTTRCSAR